MHARAGKRTYAQTPWRLPVSPRRPHQAAYGLRTPIRYTRSPVSASIEPCCAIGLPVHQIEAPSTGSRPKSGQPHGPRSASCVGIVSMLAGGKMTGGSRRSTRSATGSWRRRGSSGRFVVSKPLDLCIALVARPSMGDESRAVPRRRRGAEAQLPVCRRSRTMGSIRAPQASAFHKTEGAGGMTIASRIPRWPV